MVKRVLIVGANFENKGAQSMLFITVDEIKKRISDCEIFLPIVRYLTRDGMHFGSYIIQNLQKI